MRLIALVVLCFCLHGFAPRSYAAAAQPTDGLQRLLEFTSAKFPESPGILLSVSAPAAGLQWSSAAGRVDRGRPDLLVADQPFRIASITKVFVAAAVFRLVEDGKMGLYDPIARYLMPSTYLALRNGGYEPRDITVQQLLSHTSGLYDYAEDAGFQSTFLAPVNKHRRWTRSEEIVWAMEHGKPVGRPGNVMPTRTPAISCWAR